MNQLKNSVLLTVILILFGFSYNNLSESDKSKIFKETFRTFENGDSISSMPNWTVTGENINEKLGNSVASAGDVNGDGYSDVIVGIPYFSSYKGKVNVYYGSSYGLSTTPNWTITGNYLNEYFGDCVSTAGDVNGDGYSDVIIGAFAYSNNRGKVYVYYGSSSGLSTANWSATGENEYESFGNSVSSAGDVNGDGYSDIIIGAKGYSTHKGKVYVYNGSSSGLSTTYWSVTGENNLDDFGFSVSKADDVNGDGYSDVIIGAESYPSNSRRGKAYLYHGSSSGLLSIPYWTKIGENDSIHFGVSVSTAGDVNSDGYSDVIIGASGYPYPYGKGKVYVYCGSSSGLSSSANWTKTGENNSDHFGLPVNTAGDVNGDGYSDIIIGAQGYKSLFSNGKAYVYLGSSNGVSTNLYWYAIGENNNDYFGHSVSSAGDINGDNYDDIIIGASAYPHNMENGKAYVYHGNLNGLIIPVLISPENNSYNVSLTPTLIWNNVIGTVGYKVKISTNSDFSDIIDSVTVMTNQYSVPSGKLIHGTKYYWKVAAYDAMRTGPWSEVWNFLTTQNLILNIRIYFEGFWNGTTQIQDTTKVFLANDSPPYKYADSSSVLLSTNGTGTFNFTKCPNGNYYIVIIHRNHLETWSRLTQVFTKDIPVSYNFTTSHLQAYGGNLIFSNGAWCIFGGDINQNGFVDGTDMALLDNDLFNYASGYVVTDINGDGFVDGADMAILDNNLYNYIGVVRPGGSDVFRENIFLKSRQVRSKQYGI